MQNALAPNISITNVTYFTFLDPNQTGPNPALFNSTSGAHSGYMNETRDLGATDSSISPGRYLVASVQFTLTGAAPGIYQLKSTTLSPRASELSDTNFASHNFGASSYRITISPTGTLMSVPEPTTLSLLILTTGGFGVAAGPPSSDFREAPLRQLDRFPLWHQHRQALAGPARLEELAHRERMTVKAALA